MCWANRRPRYRQCRWFSRGGVQQRDKDAVVAVVTADHVIEPVEFSNPALRRLSTSPRISQTLVTFGIVPTHGHTGLGYIHRGEPLPSRAAAAGRFASRPFGEKPDKPTADRYVESGRYYWNSGMFVWRCDTVLGELAAASPRSIEGLMKIAAAWDTPQRKQFWRDLPALPKISIDYAVMEPATQRRARPRSPWSRCRSNGWTSDHGRPWPNLARR